MVLPFFCDLFGWCFFFFSLLCLLSYILFEILSCPFEFCQSFAQRTGQIRKFLRADDYQGNDQDYDEFWHSDSEHIFYLSIPLEMLTVLN